MSRNNNIGFVICETTSTAEEVNIVGEKNNRVQIEAIAQTAEEKNRNGRIYLAKDLRSEINSDRTKELVATRNFFGEAGHPTSKDLVRQSTIDPTNLAHNMSKIWMEGDNVKIITEGAQGPMGEMFNDLVTTGTKPAFSLRALGSIENSAKGAVVKNLRLITYDFVIYPSHKKAYMEKLVTESASFGSPSPQLIEKEGSSLIVKPENEIFVPITNDKVINYIKQESANIKNVLNSIDTLYESTSVINGGRHVQLVSKTGDMLIVNLESYIQNEIFDYCRHR